MEQSKQLNKMAVAAKNCNEQLWKLKASVHPLITSMSDKIRNHIASQEKFEEECFKQIDSLVQYYDERRGDVLPLVLRCVRRVAKRHRERYEDKGCKVVPLFQRNKDGEYEPVPVVDELAIVDVGIMVKEMIARLASDDRKLYILNAWTQGCFSDSELAVLLAQHFGGKTESHRKAVQRFRNECKRALRPVIGL